MLSNSELFWKHVECCKVCNQHPQSVASFFYEPMCNIGKAYHKATELPNQDDKDSQKDLAQATVEVG